MAYLETPERCKILLHEWRDHLALTEREHLELGKDLKVLDHQLNRLSNKRIRISVFGRVGVGKSSLLNALLNQDLFKTDIAHGCTLYKQSAIWKQKINGLNSIELVDTPGIDEIEGGERADVATKVALNSDLTLLVIDSDLTSVDQKILTSLLQRGNPVLLVLNRCDQWQQDEVKEIVQSIKIRLPSFAKQLKIAVVAAAPREPKMNSNGRIRSNIKPPNVKSLKKLLLEMLTSQGEMLLAINALKQADNFNHSIKRWRLQKNKINAQALIGKFAALKATGVAANPIVMLDMATSIALDTAMVFQLSELYGLRLKGSSARDLVKKLSIQSSFLGGAHMAIQFLLSVIRHLLLIATPFSGGVSLASSAPIALIQAGIAVQTTKLIGRLAAQELLKGIHNSRVEPSSILRRLAIENPEVTHCLKTWPNTSKTNFGKVQTLLP